MEYDIAVIGSGPGGYVAAIRAAQLGLKVVCIDKRKELGGTCLNVGCIPSKALLHDSELSHPNLSQMMKRKNEVVKSFNAGIESLFKKNKIVFVAGNARLLDSHTIEVAGEKIDAKNIILATGSEPIALPFLPFNEKNILSSTGALSLETVPKSLIVIGAGVIGLELGSVYNRLGSQVTFVEFMDRIIPTFDESLCKEALKLFTKQGMHFHLSSKATGLEGKKLKTTAGDFEADAILVCIGRKPYTESLGLENVGITPNSKGFIPINGKFQAAANIYAIGDIVDGPMLAHKASEEGIAVCEIIAGHNPTLNYMAIPNVVYTTPEIASVGLTEKEAKDFGLAINTGSFSFKANSRARCTNEEEGFVKILADAKTDIIVGIHIIGAHASELISMASLAIEKKTTALELATYTQAHPTLAEALKEAALALHKRAIHK